MTTLAKGGEQVFRRTRPVRLYDEDIERLQLAAAAEGRSFQELAHDALNEYITTHRADMARAMAAATHKVLTGDGAPLRDALREGADRRAAEASTKLEALR